MSYPTNERTLWRIRPFVSDPWLDLPPRPNTAFPFDGWSVLRAAEIGRLADMLDPTKNPGGVTVLVTGLPGAGKTSLVKRAIFQAAASARFKLGSVLGSEQAVLDAESWKEWEALVCKKHSTKRSERKQVEALLSAYRGSDAVIVFDVHVPLPDASLNERQILVRTLRRLYFRLVSTGMADANPTFVRNVRLAYIRSIANNIKIVEKARYLQTFQAGVEKGKVGLAARQELELAWELAVEIGQSDEESIGDELQLLLEDLSRLKLGNKAILERAVDALSNTFADFSTFLFGDEFLRIHPILVFDEIDKARDPKKQDFLARTVASLKTVLTATDVSFVFISGDEHARLWSGTQLESQHLRAVFADRFHVRLLELDTIKEILKRYMVPECSNDEVIDQLARALHFVSEGLLRSLVRLLREAQLNEMSEWDRARRFASTSLEYVLTAGVGEKERKDRMAKLVRGYDIIDKAHSDALGMITAREMPAASNRVAGRRYAVRDDVYRAVRDVYRLFALYSQDLESRIRDNDLSEDLERIEESAREFLKYATTSPAVILLSRWLSLGFEHRFPKEFVRQVLSAIREQSTHGVFIDAIERALEAREVSGSDIRI